MFQNNVSVRLIIYYLVHIIKNKISVIFYVHFILILMIPTWSYDVHDIYFNFLPSPYKKILPLGSGPNHLVLMELYLLLLHLY